MKEPLYSIIASQAEARIRSGAWQVGTRLPPERELCRELEVSRATLRQALDELEGRGLITRHQGRGTFVARARVQTPLSGFFSIMEALRARGLEVTTRVLRIEVVDASRQVAADLARMPGDPIVHIERLRVADGEPLVLERSHLPLDLFPGLTGADLEHRSLYDILRDDHGRTVMEAVETIEPVILTPHECGLLAVPRHTPAILTRRITRDDQGDVVELGQALLRGDRSRFLLVRHVGDIGDRPGPLPRPGDVTPVRLARAAIGPLPRRTPATAPQARRSPAR
jgi:GntR family transcriptional regulator